jgi:hypothetical protein
VVGSLVGDMMLVVVSSTCSLIEDVGGGEGDGSFCGDGVGALGVSKSEKGRR